MSHLIKIFFICEHQRHRFFVDGKHDCSTMPRYYSSSDSLNDVTCSVNCCCLWMFLVVLTIVPGFLLVVIGCPCKRDTSLNFSNDLCIDCAIIGDIFLSIGGSVTIVGCLYYCCLNYCLKLSSGAAGRRKKLNRVPRITVSPTDNQSCQMQTMNDSQAVINMPENTVDIIPCASNERLKRGNYSPIQEENILLNDCKEQTFKVSMKEETSSMSSLFSDTVLNAGDDSKV